MRNELGITLEQPIPILEREWEVNGRELLKAVGKAIADTAFGNWNNVALDAVEAAVALGLGKTEGELAWQLVLRSLGNAMTHLVWDNRDLIKPEFSFQGWKQLTDEISFSLGQTELTIDDEFFRQPKRSTILTVIQPSFQRWLTFIMENEAQAQSMTARLPAYFVYALHEEWLNHREQYAVLQQQLDTPFSSAAEQQQGWGRYSAWLQKQVQEPMFLEAFGLAQVFVPLCAYYVEKQTAGDAELEFRERGLREKHDLKIVIDLETQLEAWLEKHDQQDALRVISGGPGCGKSSFTKMFAAKQAERGAFPVLWIPLHQFEPTNDLIEATGDFVRLDGFLRLNPLDPEYLEPKLLVVFDGLDELSMQGKVGAQVAQDFVREVQKKLDRLNQHQLRVRAIISGRELVVQANQTEFRKPGEVLHILPYFVKPEDREEFVDEQQLLVEDRRDRWWRSYGSVSGRGFDQLPSDLSHDNLSEITAQPLLNYLVALSYVRGELRITEDSNLNEIYADLLKEIYVRRWADKRQHESIRDMTQDRFERILEEIALSSWHGDGRTTTVREIEAHCNNSGLKGLLNVFQEGAQSGVTRLLMAFYFRQSGMQDGEKTFEFTHKSFGEYLTARRVVRELERIHEELEARERKIDRGWDERQALEAWANLCGSSEMDRYLFRFICDEMRLQPLETVRIWQEMLSHLIGFMLKQGMPMEKLHPRPSYLEETRQARNAEEALLAVLNACALCTKELSHVDWSVPEAFGAWLSRLQGQRTGGKNPLALDCLSFLDLQDCILDFRDLYGARLDEARLDGAGLVGARLDGASLYRARLDGASLDRASLYGARLVGTSLDQASLYGTSLYGASLDRARLYGARLDQASLDEDTNLYKVTGLDQAINVPPEFLELWRQQNATLDKP
ncbi:pentapeptide repeat-containing protein [Cyanobacteria bacterium FACHB-63]|nr:pentapeptide repeat-containing protein [Cyanobacteria bacterium FACHB-63]